MIPFTVRYVLFYCKLCTQNLTKQSTVCLFKSVSYKYLNKTIGILNYLVDVYHFTILVFS